MSEETNSTPDEVARVRTIRRIGYVVLGLASAYIALPMLVSALIGLSNGEIWDPYTGEPYDATPDCYAQAKELLERAEEIEDLDTSWTGPVQEWTAKCRDDHADLHRLLVDTREELEAKDSMVRP
jgi:hypothetical protein